MKSYSGIALAVAIALSAAVGASGLTYLVTGWRLSCGFGRPNGRIQAWSWLFGAIAVALLLAPRLAGWSDQAALILGLAGIPLMAFSVLLGARSVQEQRSGTNLPQSGGTPDPEDR